MKSLEGEIVKNRNLASGTDSSELASKHENVTTALQSAQQIINRNLKNENAFKYSRSENFYLIVIDALDFFLEEKSDVNLKTNNLFVKQMCYLAKSVWGESDDKILASSALKEFITETAKFISQDAELSSFLECGEYIDRCRNSSGKFISHVNSEEDFIKSIQSNSKILREYQKIKSTVDENFRETERRLDTKAVNSEISKIFAKDGVKEQIKTLTVIPSITGKAGSIVPNFGEILISDTTEKNQESSNKIPGSSPHSSAFSEFKKTSSKSISK